VCVVEGSVPCKVFHGVTGEYIYVHHIPGTTRRFAAVQLALPGLARRLLVTLWLPVDLDHACGWPAVLPGWDWKGLLPLAGISSVHDGVPRPLKQ
jgi:hypothetical protein